MILKQNPLRVILYAVALVLVSVVLTTAAVSAETSQYPLLTIEEYMDNLEVNENTQAFVDEMSEHSWPDESIKICVIDNISNVSGGFGYPDTPRIPLSINGENYSIPQYDQSAYPTAIYRSGYMRLPEENFTADKNAKVILLFNGSHPIAIAQKVVNIDGGDCISITVTNEQNYSMYRLMQQLPVTRCLSKILGNENRMQIDYSNLDLKTIWWGSNYVEVFNSGNFKVINGQENPVTVMYQNYITYQLP